MGSPAFFRECRAKYGPVFKVAFGRTWMVVVAEPDLLRAVGSKLLNHSLFRSLMRGDFDKLDDWGLVAARDAFWRRARAAWQPAFSAASLSGYLPLMERCATMLTDKLEALAGSRVDLWRELGSMTLQVVGSTAYGVDFQAIEPHEAQSDTDGGKATSDQQPQQQAPPTKAADGSTHFGNALVHACRDVFRYSSVVYGTKYSRVGLLLPEVRPLVSVIAHALPDPPFTKLLQARGVLKDACMALIDSWRGASGSSSSSAAAASKAGGGGAAAKEPPAAAAAATAGNGHTTGNGTYGSGGTAAVDDGGGGGGDAGGVAPGSFLELMLSNRDKSTGEALTDMQVAAQVQTFILAGYETTANALAFTVYCLANNPEAEARLLAEIDEVLGPDRPPSEADLGRLPYTEAVFNESMRLFPPAHATNRHPDKPLEVGGVRIPANVPLFMSIFSSHHNPDVWPQADKFIPERFLPASPLHAEVRARVLNAHAPFGYGSRMCIGWKFAVQEAKTALARLYQRLRFELEPGQVPLRTAVGITLSPRNGVWVRPVLRRA